MMKKHSVLLTTAALALALAATMPAQAQFKDAKDAVNYREAAMTLMASHFGRMAPMAKREMPFDADFVRTNVDLLNTLAELPWPAYAEGTEGGNAKPNVWSDAAGFEKARKTFEDNLAKLDAAADEGNLNSFRVAFGEVGKSCKGCHDTYRKD